MSKFMADSYEPILSEKESLTKKYDAWLSENGYDPMCAMELIYELQSQPKTAKTEADIRWLSEFVREWESVEC